MTSLASEKVDSNGRLNFADPNVRALQSGIATSISDIKALVPRLAAFGPLNILGTTWSISSVLIKIHNEVWDLYVFAVGGGQDVIDNSGGGLDTLRRAFLWLTGRLRLFT